MLSKTELAKALTDCRRRVGGNFSLKERRMNRTVRVINMRQFNCEAAIRFNKAMDEYRYKTRQAVPCRAEYFFYNRKHKERNTGYVLAYGSEGHKWFARKRDADAALRAMLDFRG